MRHSRILNTQLVQGVSANGGPNSGYTANMVGMTVRADGTEHMHARVFGSDVRNEVFAFPSGIDNQAFATRNNDVTVGLDGPVYKHLNRSRTPRG
jgi:hypothetical protein